MKKLIRNMFTILSIAALVIVGTPISTSNSYAVDTSLCGQDSYNSNDIVWYDPCSSASASVCGEPTTAGEAVPITAVHGSNNGEKIFNFWVDAGLTSQQAAGITGSMQAEAGFSAFRQEEAKTWPAGGWGIAQFTGEQRDKATAYVKDTVGEATFNEYYKDKYGGAVTQAKRFIPTGVPESVNDQFLLGELSYLLETVKGLKPNNIRTSGLKADYGQSVEADQTLFEYLGTIEKAESAAEAWTYLYEYPADIKATALKRAGFATKILKLYSVGTDTSAACGGSLVTGGMNLEQAKEFMKTYRESADSVDYIGGAGRTCTGGALANCVSFSMYFLNKYANVKGTSSGRTGNGGFVVGVILGNNPDMKTGHSPQPYAVFSTFTSGADAGHTGVILGVDTERGKVIVGQASCNRPLSSAEAVEYNLSAFDSNAYEYAYTGDYLKGDL